MRARPHAEVRVHPFSSVVQPASYCSGQVYGTCKSGASPSPGYISVPLRTSLVRSALHCLQVLARARITNPKATLHSTTLRRHLHRHHNSTRWEPPAGRTAAANKKPSRKCCLRAIRARPFGAHKHDTVIQGSTGGGPKTVRSCMWLPRKQCEAWPCVFSFTPRHLHISTSTLLDVASRLSSGLTGCICCEVCRALLFVHLLKCVRCVTVLVRIERKDHEKHTSGILCLMAQLTGEDWARQYTSVPTSVVRARTCQWPPSARRVGAGVAVPDRDRLRNGPTFFSNRCRPAARWPVTMSLVLAWQGKQIEAG